ncbi:MAG: cation-translocating P-type ATPase [Nitrososphaerales archaeon]
MILEKDWHAIEIDDVIKELRSDKERGLSEFEAKSRLITYGPNELLIEKKISPIKIFFKQFANILLGILLVATAISALIGEVIDAIVIFIIILFVVILGFIQEYRAERTLESLKKMLSPTCTVIRDGNEKEIAVKELVPGDIVILKSGDKIPADIRLIEAVNLQVDESSLTGESFPVEKKSKILPKETPVMNRTNMVFSGTIVTYGKGKGIVIASGMRTEFGKIAKEVTAVTTERTPLERRMSEIGRKLGLIVIAIISIVTLVEILEEYIILGSISFGFFLEVLMFGIALAVAVVPEALPAIVTGSLAISMHIMAKKNALVRRMPVVETLGATQIICSDKTGTLTKGEMTVRQVYISSKKLDVTGSGYEPKGDILYEGKPIDNSLKSTLERLAKAIILCNDSRLEKDGNKWIVRGDPTEGALIVLAEKSGLSQDEVRKLHPRVAEIPFSSERKLMTTIHSEEDGVYIACMKGAPEVVLNRCKYLLENGQIREMNEEDKKLILAVNEEMARNALRTLGVAERILYEKSFVLDSENFEKDFTFLGLVGMIDPPRKEAIDAVKVAKQVGMIPIMITGDHKLTAIAIAKEMSIYKEGDLVLTGEELERLNDKEFENIVEKVTVYARVSPLHKLRIVEAWKKKNRVVAMTGDGVNDAPALKRSDIGIAMGITGTDVAKEASALILSDDNFATIVKAIELGRWIYDNIKKYLAYLLQANLVEIAVMTIGALFILRFMGFIGETALPLLPVHILYINLATDGLPALALGFSPADPDLMKRPPRPKDEPVFTRDLVLFLIRALLIETPILTIAFMSGLNYGMDAARTRLFLMFVFIELTVALNCRSLIFTINKAKPHKWLLLSIFWESFLLITLLQIPVAREALHILYPTFEDLIWIGGGMMVTFISIEALKHFNIRKH